MIAPRFSAPLQKDSSASAGTPIEITGPHRFVTIKGRSGYQPTSLSTRCRIGTELHRAPRGSVAMWVCPLESLGVAPPMEHTLKKDPTAQEYGLIGDTFPVNDIGQSIFCWYWRSAVHPQMIAKFKPGFAANGAADYSVTPYVPVEHLPLHAGEWYHLVFTWDKPASDLRVYVNGILCGTTAYPFECADPKPELFLGNPAMVFSELALYDVALDAAAIEADYQKAAVGKNAAVNAELRSLFTPQPRARADWQPGADWTLAFDRSLTREGDFDDWMQQGCSAEPYRLKEFGITPEGLLVQTPDEVHVETRVYFWSPQIFEGDLAVSYDFKVEQETGLALLIVQASGMQREDFIRDHPKRTTGSMGTILTDRVRNYHWEYYRKTVDVRCDLGTHVMIKNPWLRPMQMSTTPPVSLHEWHRLLFVQEGARLRAAIDGEWVLDVRDDPFGHSGPVFNTGRIGLRMMYGTRMRYRHLKVWNRPQF